MFSNQSDTLISAPELTDVATTFAAWKTYTGNATASLDDFFDYITTPSADRTIFISCRTGTLQLVNNRFARQHYV